MKTLRDEISDKIMQNEKFSEDEILHIFKKIEASLNYLHKIGITPSFITIDNICYDPTKPTKEWVLNI